MKRSSNQQSLAEVIKDFLKESGWSRKLDQVNLISQWDKLLGPNLAKYTEELYINRTTLYIRLNSSTLRQELSYKKTDLVKELNQMVGKEVITDIVLK